MRNEIFLSLLLGFLLDCLVGDPHSIPHPVVLIGKLISVTIGCGKPMMMISRSGVCRS